MLLFMMFGNEKAVDKRPNFGKSTFEAGNGRNNKKEWYLQRDLNSYSDLERVMS